MFALHTIGEKFVFIRFNYIKLLMLNTGKLLLGFRSNDNNQAGNFN